MFALLSLAVWLGLLLFHGRFWSSLPQLHPGECPAAPPVDIIIPARDEAETIGEVIASLVAQQYSGTFRIILVDDNSSDGTAALAGASANLQIIDGLAKPPGWSGKLWALEQGIAASNSPLVLLTDADIVHAPGHLAALVARIQSPQVDLVSEMVRLNCTSVAEKTLVPAFVYFFQMLYPFAKVNDARSGTAAGGGRDDLIASRSVAKSRWTRVDP